MDCDSRDNQERIAMDQVNSFLDKCIEAKQEKTRSVSLGTDYRFVSDTVVGSGLVFKSKVVHLTLFNKEAGNGNRRPRTRLNRMSGRLRYFLD